MKRDLLHDREICRAIASRAEIRAEADQVRTARIALAAIDRTLAAEARVAELEGRKCETCADWDGRDGEGACFSQSALGLSDDLFETSAEFGCVCWKKRGGQ